METTIVYFLLILCLTTEALSSSLNGIGYETLIGEVGMDLQTTMNCEGNDLSKIIWKRDNEIIYLNGKVLVEQNRYKFHKLGKVLSFQIKSLKLDDGGFYTCSELLQTPELKKYHLLFKERVAIKEYSGPIIDVDEGNGVEIWCNASGLPKPDIWWEIVVDPSDQSREIGIKGRMLGIRSVTRDCDVTYRCKAYNGYKASEPVYKDIKLNAKFPPDVKIIGQIGDTSFKAGNISGSRGDRVLLQCEVTANPSAIITWYRDNIYIVKYTADNIAEKNSQNTENSIYMAKLQVHEESKVLDLEFQLDADYTFANYVCKAENEWSTKTSLRISKKLQN